MFFNLLAVKLPAPLVDALWLKPRLGRVNLFDATFVMPNSGRSAAAEFHHKHIPKAQFFDLDIASDYTSALPHMLPSAEDFTDYMLRQGFDARRSTVIYDDGTWLGAARLWWMLRFFGYDNIALLQGGLPAWEDAGYAVTDKIGVPKTGHFEAEARLERVWTMTQVEANLQAESPVCLLDARSAERFRGAAPEPRANLRRGHIPGSRNLPYAQLIDPQTGHFHAPEQLDKIFAEAGITEHTRIVTTCGSGVSACVLAFGLYLTGRDDIAVYDGSWAEWGDSRALRPAMIGA